MKSRYSELSFIAKHIKVNTVGRGGGGTTNKSWRPYLNNAAGYSFITTKWSSKVTISVDCSLNSGAVLLTSVYAPIGPQSAAHGSSRARRERALNMKYSLGINKP